MPCLQKSDIRVAVYQEVERQTQNDLLWKDSKPFNSCGCDSSISSGAKSALLRLDENA